MQFLYKKAYLKKFDSYGYNEQKLIIAADSEIRKYYITHKAAYGLRIKKLYDNGIESTLEARVSKDIRILWVEKGNIVSFAFMGNHDEIRRYIRSFR